MIACIGGAHLDRHGVLREPLILGTSNPGRVHTAFGGVARNVAENLARLGLKTTLLSRVGDDEAGRHVLRHSTSLGIDTYLCTISPERPTASYTAIVEATGELVLGLADRDIYLEMEPAALSPALPVLRVQQHWFIDSNVPAPTISWLLEQAGGIPVAVDAISVALARGLGELLPRIPLLFANLAQAASIAQVPRFADAAEAAAALRTLGARAGVLTAGATGIAAWSAGAIESMPALPAEPRDVTGAGDALVAATLFGIVRGQSLPSAARLGLAAAAITVESRESAAPELTPELLAQRLAAHAHAR